MSSGTTTLPTWAVVLTPGLAFLGAGLGHLVSLVTGRATEKRWRREETMRMLRWAAEKAVDEDDAVAYLGVQTLAALSRSPLLQQEDRRLIRAVTEAVAGDTLGELASAEATAAEVAEAGNGEEAQR